MFYLDPQTNTRYQLNRPFTYNSIQYTRAGATHETFQSLGFTQVVVGARPDDRFYIVSGPDNAGQYSATPRDVVQLKASYIIEAKRQAYQILSRTDWMIIKGIEVQTFAVSPEVSVFRQTVRNLSDVRCNMITATTNVEELKAVIDTPINYGEEPEGSY